MNNNTEITDKLMEIKKLYESGILTEEEYQMQEENLINSCNNTTANLDGFCNKFLMAVILCLCLIVLSSIGVLKVSFAARYLGHLPTPQNRIALLIFFELLTMLVLAVPTFILNYSKKKNMYRAGIAMISSFFLIVTVSYFVDITISNYLFLAFWLLSPLSIAYALKILPQNIKRNIQEANGWLFHLVFILSAFLPPMGIGLVGIGIIGILCYIFIYKTQVITKGVLGILMLIPALLLSVGYFALESKSSPIDAVKSFVSGDESVLVIYDYDEAKCHPIEDKIQIKSNELSINDKIKEVRLNNDVNIAYVQAKYRSKDVTFIVQCEEGKAIVLSTIGLYSYDFTEFKKKYGFTLEYKDDLSPEMESKDAVECVKIVRSYIKAHNLQAFVLSVKLIDWFLHIHEDNVNKTYEVRCNGGLEFSVSVENNQSKKIYVIKKIKGL